MPTTRIWTGLLAAILISAAIVTFVTAQDPDDDDDDDDDRWDPVKRNVSDPVDQPQLEDDDEVEQPLDRKGPLRYQQSSAEDRQRNPQKGQCPASSRCSLFARLCGTNGQCPVGQICCRGRLLRSCCVKKPTKKPATKTKKPPTKKQIICPTPAIIPESTTVAATPAPTAVATTPTSIIVTTATAAPAPTTTIKGTG